MKVQISSFSFDWAKLKENVTGCSYLEYALPVAPNVVILVRSM